MQLMVDVFFHVFFRSSVFDLEHLGESLSDNHAVSATSTARVGPLWARNAKAEPRRKGCTLGDAIEKVHLPE